MVGVMKNEIKLLNLICLLAAVGFLVLALLNALSSGSFISTDNLFITMVCLVMAVMFAASPLLYLKSEGKLPIPFQKRLKGDDWGTQSSVGTQTAPPLLDSKGRAVPPDVRSMVARMKEKQP
jgi:hypothetical protein